jgi:glycerol kinase
MAASARSSARDLLLAIDQQTTVTRAFLYTPDARVLAQVDKPLRQIYPGPGRIEVDPGELLADVVQVCRAALRDGGASAADLAGIGIANQRETALLWDAATGRALANAIGWQDRRTASHCAALRADGLEPDIAARTGLRLDSTFSATKLAWMLDALPGARARAEAGELRFGTVDSWLLWHLTGGQVHATDPSNAARTLLFNLHGQAWDPLLLAAFRIPAPLLPAIADTAGARGTTDAALFGAAVPIHAAVGNQQAALAGQACVRAGLANCSYGTGAFALVHAGNAVPRSAHRLLATQAWRINGVAAFALEGAILNAGTAIAWLRDGLGLLREAADSEALAESAEESSVFFVPAFTGFGAPHWNADARGAILGITRDTSRAEISRAALEAQAFQTRDLLDAMELDLGAPIERLRVDGGPTRNDFACQAIADLCGVVVERPADPNPTARGAAVLAAVGAGLISALEAAPPWHADRVFEPRMGANARTARLAGWRRAVRAVLTMAGEQ